MALYNKLFPKANELTAFVVTVVLYAIVLISPELLNDLWLFAVESVKGWQENWELAKGFKEHGEVITQIFFVVIIGIPYLIGPLFLPFTRKDIQFLGVIILWLDALLVLFWNIKYFDWEQWYRLLPIIYLTIWLFSSILIARGNYPSGYKHIISDEQTTPLIALGTSLAGVLIALIILKGFGFWWLDAYVFSLFAVFIAKGTFKKLLSTQK